jgi:hypothetical protein
LNAYAERFVRSIKSECLGKLVLLGENHLRTAVREYVAHYHIERNHQGLEGRLIEPPANDSGTGPIDCRERRRVALGRCRPRAPTDPDVRISRIRFLGDTGSLRGAGAVADARSR